MTGVAGSITRSQGDLTTTAKSLYEIGGLDSLLDNVLRGDIYNTSTNKFDQLYSLGNLILNYWFDMFLFLLLPTVLFFNIFG
jgi:hypothetical protein